MIDTYRWQLLAYVLMSNHYHLFFRTPATNLSRGMKDLDGDHASFFNARHGRAGHLFQGRFKSHLVDGETYLLEVARYIVLNPVRARIVETPGEWRWSSYRATAGLAAVPHWLDPGPILDVFHSDDWNVAMHGYREFVAAAIGHDASPWEDLVAGTFLGGKEFLRQMQTAVKGFGQEPELTKSPRALFVACTSDLPPLTIESIRQTVESMRIADCWPPPPGSDARLLIALLSARHAESSRAEIGRLLGITAPGALRVIRSGETRETKDPEFAKLLLDVEELLRKGSGRNRN